MLYIYINRRKKKVSSQGIILWSNAAPWSLQCAEKREERCLPDGSEIL